MTKKNVLLLCGGGGAEHDVSLVSVKHIHECLKNEADITVHQIEINRQGHWVDGNGKKLLLDQNCQLRSFAQDGDPGIKIDFAIPCIHGYPGETGDIQSYFEMIGLPYLGCNSETSKMCFNKITTKMWASALGVANTPYAFVTNLGSESFKQAEDFHTKHGEVVVKASNQGSSVGCYLVEKNGKLREALEEAFKYSPFVLMEKRLSPRELEVSVYELEGKVHVSYPGEISCPTQFYSYEEKYSEKSKTTTTTRAEGLTEKQVQLITDYSTRLYSGLKIRHLSRIDYFLHDGMIYLNEINTFPGLTPISMFPKMMEANGHSFKAFLIQHIRSA